MWCRHLEEAHTDNRELVHRLAAQEEALHYSSRQLEQRSAECQALTRQLETALTDVRLQVKPAPLLLPVSGGEQMWTSWPSGP